MNNNTLLQSDIKLLPIDNQITLFYHAETLQIYPIENSELLNFLLCYRESGYVVTKSKYPTYKFYELYNFICKKISGAPKSIIYEEVETEKNDFYTIILPISDVCNLNCSYCFAQTDGGFKFGSFNKSAVKKIVDFLVNENRDESIPLTIIFFGGEPLIKIDLICFTVEYIKEKYPNRNVSFSITSNGTILNERIIKFLKENNFAILLSLDGPENEFNLRNFKNNRNSTAKVLNNIQTFKGNGIFPHIRATMVNNNPYICETYSFFENLKLPFDIVFAYSSENITHNYASYNKRILDNIKLQYFELLQYYIGKLKNKETIYNKILREMASTIRFRLKKRLACSAGLSYFTILSNGNIFSCAHLMNNGNMKIGNIEVGIEDKSMFIPVDVEKIIGCQKCWARHLCLGGCFAQKKSLNRSNYHSLPANECELQKIRWNFALLLYYYTMKIAPENIKPKVKQSINC